MNLLPSYSLTAAQAVESYIVPLAGGGGNYGTFYQLLPLSRLQLVTKVEEAILPSARNPPYGVDPLCSETENLQAKRYFLKTYRKYSLEKSLQVEVRNSSQFPCLIPSPGQRILHDDVGVGARSVASPLSSAQVIVQPIRHD